VPTPDSHNDRVSRWGYVAAIVVSALGHAVFVFVIFVVLPGLFSAKPPPPSYTVKIVDALPAGDLGTHLPRLNQSAVKAPKAVAPKVADNEAPTSITTPPPTAPDEDKDSIALNTHHSPTPKSTPPPRRPIATATATPRPRKREQPRPRETPTPQAQRRKPRAVPSRELARAAAKPTPNIRQEMRKLHEQLMAEHLKQMREEGDRTPGTGGPVLASRDTEGNGYGVGAGSGSAGILQNADFLLYYQSIKKKIQDAWNFAGKNPRLTATVTVGINPDGSLNAVRVSDPSRDPAFDDSVVRAIRLAAPFSPPPEQYRPQFAEGVPVIFNLGALEGADESGG
jgi:TonB family protein